MKNRRVCDHCGLVFTGDGYAPGDGMHFCCCGCYLVHRIIGGRSSDGIASWILVRLGIGAFLSMNVMMASLVLYTSPASELGLSAVYGLRWAMVILSTPAVVILGAPFVLGSLRELQRGRISTDALISTGSLTAYAVSTANVIRDTGHVYFDTATMLLFIVTLGRLIEAAAKSRASRSIRELIDLAPATARVLRNDSETDIPISEVVRGDRMLVRTGEKVPADGVITSGECMVEEPAFTGESKPRVCGPSDSVFGGSVNCDGLIEVTATAVGAESLLSQIHDLVQRAQQERAPVERLTERVSSIFVPAVWLATLAAAAYWGLLRGDIEMAGMSALAVLVVACPCALGLATPMATCLAIGRAARAGVLIRSGEVLESLPTVRTILFDKTGTLTTNDLSVAEVHTVPGYSEEEAISMAASLESACTHSIARAVLAHAGSLGISPKSVSDVRVVSGRGVTGTVETSAGPVAASVGSAKLVSDVPEELKSQDDLTTAYVAWKGKIVAAITFRDSLRDESPKTLEELAQMGVRTAVVSGDLDAPTRRLASVLGIDDIRSECSPQEKVTAVQEARKRSAGAVAMVGDGINDAPALAEADVGIATGGGTDLARQASDVTLLGDDLSRIPWTLRLAGKTYTIIRQNLFWAFFYNCAAVVLAFLGFVHPLIAASAMVVSSAAVIANSLRILRMDV